MNVISLKTLKRFWKKHPTSQAPLTAWHAIVHKARWSNFADVQATFNTADHVGNGKIVFDIGGNNYRLVALVGFRTKRLFILWTGTHAEYDKIDVTKL